MALNVSDVGLMAFQKAMDIFRSSGSKSLIEYTSSHRAEPFVILDSECVFLDETSDVMHSLQSQYAAYYVLAMSMLTTTIGNVQVSRHMDKLNPSRSAINSAANSAAALGGLYTAVESIKSTLLDIKESANVVGDLMGRDKDSGNVQTLSAGTTRDTVKEITELSNLSVGKVISIELHDGNSGSTVTVPVAIRLIANSLSPDAVANNLLAGELNKAWTDRWHGWKSGRLSLVDMLFCKDLVDAHRKNLMNDTNGLYRAINERRNKNRLSALLSGDPSVGTFSNMYVITEATAKMVEAGMQGGTLKDYKAREKLFDNTAVMILAVMDRNWKRVTYYHQGLNRYTEVSFRDLKVANKGSGPDISEILNAYRLGSAPVL